MKRRFFSLVMVASLALTACAPATAIPVSTSTESPLPTATIKPITPRPLPEETAFTLAGQLGGTVNAVALAGKTAYAGIGTRLVTVDISDPTAPRFLGQSDPLLSVVEAVAVQDGMAYVAAGSDLHIYDISKSVTPVRVSTLFHLADADKLSRRYIFPAGDFVYVHYRPAFQGRASLVAINVNDPAQPVVVERLDLAVTAAVAISSGILYIVNEGSVLNRIGFAGSLMSKMPRPPATAVYSTFPFKAGVVSQ